MGERESVSAAKRAARLERRNAALALRPSLSPTGPAPDRLRIATDTRLAARLDSTWIDHTERSTEPPSDPPSDHSALIADFHLADPR